MGNKQATGRPPDMEYSKTCAVCKFMKKNKDFKIACMQSTYFNPDGAATLTDVNLSFNEPFKLPALYQHFKRHQKAAVLRAQQKAKATGSRLSSHAVIKQTKAAEAARIAALVEGEVSSTGAHERGLDAFIAAGRAKLDVGEMSITAATFLQAIKVKAEIEKSTKDRRMDAVKTLFKGAAPKTEADPDV